MKTGVSDELVFPDNPNSLWLRIPETLWYIFLSVSIFWSSFFVMLVVIKTPQLHYPPGYLMVCMSVCDIFMSVLVGTAAVPAFNHPFRYPSFVCQGQAIMLAFFQVSLLSLLKNSFFLEFSTHM